MRPVPDWWIQSAWWASGIFATGALWYFLSTREYGFAAAAAIAALALAGVAIGLHRKKDALSPRPTQTPEQHVPTEKDKLVTSAWWEASDLRKEYEHRGFKHFYWSKPELIPEREGKGYEVVYLDDSAANARYRIVNKSGQVLLAKRDA
jgi:hypothetical protein